MEKENNNQNDQNKEEQLHYEETTTELREISREELKEILENHRKWLESEGKEVGARVLEYIHYSKTGALLKACVRCGAIASGANSGEMQSLTKFGSKIGLIFQIVDDILDVTSSSEVLGKTAGKDEKVKKATYPALYGIDASRKKARELMSSALEDIRDFDEKAEPLRSLARLVVDRTA